MINLRKIINYEYVDDSIVEIFDDYKWGLIRLGIKFDQELLEAIVYCPANLEDTFRAFSAWVLWLRNKGEKPDEEILKLTLLNALRNGGWIPFDFQENLINQYQHIFDSPQDLYWKAAKEDLGYELRNKLISDIKEDGTIIFRENTNIDLQDKSKIEKLKLHIAELRKFF